MRRPWIPIATIGLAAVAVLVVASAILFRPFETAGPPSASATAPDAEDAGPPIIPWVFFSQLPPDGGPGAFVVQAGVFGENRPRLDFDVPWTVDTQVEISRTPAVARPAAGAVVYVADDGATSTIHRVAIEPGANHETLATVDDAVWSIAVAPDQSVAFIAVATRGRPDLDLGIFRVALDGSGTVEPFAPPVAVAPDPGVRLVALAPFMVTLDISADGRYLARNACRGVEGCATSLIEISTGAVRDLGDEMLMDLGTDGMILVESCNDVRCGARVVDVDTGDSMALASQGFDTAVGSLDGRAVIVGIEPADGGPLLVVTDPGTGARRELHQARDDRWMMLGNRSHLMPPIDGAVLVVEVGQGKGDTGQRYVLLPLDGGEGIELPPPPIRPIVEPFLNG